MTTYGEPAMAVTGEIELYDGTKVLVPVRRPEDWRLVPVVSGPEEFPLADAYVISQPIPAPSTYLSDPRPGLTWTGVMDAISEGPESHAEGRNDDRRMPVWPVVCILLGLVLMVLGVNRDPVSLFVWSLLH